MLKERQDPCQQHVSSCEFDYVLVEFFNQGQSQHVHILSLLRSRCISLGVFLAFKPHLLKRSMDMCCSES